MITHTAFPEQHQRVMQDPADPIHRACDFFLLSAEDKAYDIAALNHRLHDRKAGAPWPAFLVAFASNGCGDYFAYDTRQSPPPVIYIDPDATPEENLADPEALRYSSFEEWYESQLEQYTCRSCGSHEVRFEASQDGQWLLRICSACGLEERAVAVEP